jgi:hypothetical protein
MFQRKVISVALGTAVLVGPFSAGDAAASVASSRPADLGSAAVTNASSERAIFGLRSDARYVAELQSSALDVGSAAVGLPLTRAELSSLNLPARAEKADRADKKIRAAAMRDPGFAGLFQDQLHGGRIVVRFTKATGQTREAIRKASGPDDVVVQDGAALTFSVLQAAVDTALVDRATLFPEVQVYGAGVDEVNNRVDLAVSSSSLATATTLSAQFATRLGAPVHVVSTTAPHDQAQVCDSVGRTTCYNPMKAGTLVDNASWDGSECTMGFHVQDRANTARKGFVLSAHCSYHPSGSASWYMNGWAGPYNNGYIGAVQKSDYKDLGEDFMVVSMPANQASKEIYDTTRAVAGSGNPVLGETIYISPGEYDEMHNTGIDTGVVAHATYSYVDDTTGFIIHAADADNFATVDGDSGSPIYRALGAGAVALGAHTTAQGWFARMQDSLDAANWGIN